MPEQNPLPEDLITNDAHNLSDLEMDVLHLASFVHVSALTFARVGMADVRSRQKKQPKEKTNEEIASCLEFLGNAGRVGFAVFIYLMEQNPESDLIQLKSALEEFKHISLSDEFEEKLEAFGKQISRLSVDRMNRQRAQRLSKN